MHGHRRGGVLPTTSLELGVCFDDKVGLGQDLKTFCKLRLWGPDLQGDS